MMTIRTLKQLRDEIQKAKVDGGKYSIQSIKLKLYAIEAEYGVHARNEAVHDLDLEGYGLTVERV